MAPKPPKPPTPPETPDLKETGSQLGSHPASASARSRSAASEVPAKKGFFSKFKCT